MTRAQSEERVGGDRRVLLRGPDLARVRAVLVLGGVPLGEIEDGVQQVRLKLVEEDAKSRQSSLTNRRSWLAVVASRVALDWHRSRRRDLDLRSRLEQRWSRVETENLEHERILALVVADGLEQLSAAQRQVLVLRHYEDLTVADIAQCLHIPEGTVKSRLHAAAGAMRDCLNEMGVT